MKTPAFLAALSSVVPFPVLFPKDSLSDIEKSRYYLLFYPTFSIIILKREKSNADKTEGNGRDATAFSCCTSIECVYFMVNGHFLLSRIIFGGKSSSFLLILPNFYPFICQ